MTRATLRRYGGLVFRFAVIAVLAAFGAPAVARALQPQPPGGQRLPGHGMGGHGQRPGAPGMPQMRPGAAGQGILNGQGVPNHGSPDRHLETREEKESAKAEEEPEAINFSEFGNSEQPPYLAALINFGLLMVLYYALGKKPLAAALKARRETVVKDIEEAQRMKHDAEERAKQYQTKLANLEDELATTRAALQESGKADRDRIVKEAEEKAARMQKEATFMLEQEVKQMRLDLQRETVDLAVLAATEMLEKRVTAEDQERMAEEFLRSLQIDKAADKAASTASVSP